MVPLDTGASIAPTSAKLITGRSVASYAFAVLLCGCGGGDGGTAVDGAPAIVADAMTPDAPPPCDTSALAGAGTDISPYLLCDGGLLQFVDDSPENLAATYELDRSIVAPAEFVSIGPEFLGELRGNGHELELGSIAVPATGGLFVTLGANALVRDLRVVGVIDGTSTATQGFVAGRNNGRIENVAVDASMTANDHSGMLVGVNAMTGEIERCDIRGTVVVLAHSGGVAGENSGSILKCHSSAAVSGSNRQGGLVGTQSGGTITMSTATGSVDGTGVDSGCLVGSFFGGEILDSSGRCTSVIGANASGGLVGGSIGIVTNITNSYAWSEAVTGASVGGLIGDDDMLLAVIGSSYYNLDVTPLSDGGTGLNGAQLIQAGSFLGWDFSTIWEVTAGEPPALRWRTAELPVGTL